MSTATTDSGSDTEVIFFTPELIKNNESLICINKRNESISDEDNSKRNKTNGNTNTFNFEESQHFLNIHDHIKTIPNDINKSNELTENCNPDNSYLTNSNIGVENTIHTSLVDRCNGPLNDIAVKNKNELNLNNECAHKKKNGTKSSLEFLKTDSTTFINGTVVGVNNNLVENDTIMSNNEHSNIIDGIENNEYSLDTIENNSKTCENHSNLNGSSDIVSNNSNLPKKMIASKNDCKPIKLNVVTTEPYPKYTPTVEKAIKKYENKQPKKECIVM